MTREREVFDKYFVQDIGFTLTRHRVSARDRLMGRLGVLINI